jgi:pyridoxamine 5'-phosphate oxidase
LAPEPRLNPRASPFDASRGSRYHHRVSFDDLLPEPLPDNPLALAAVWLNEAVADAAQPNPNAMVLATVGPNGQPSARVVLCKELAPDTGSVVFFTHFNSRKGVDIESNPRAAIAMHFDHRHRQVRIEGVIGRVSEAESDAYFRSRPWPSRLGAWASQQSRSLDSRQALLASIAREAKRFGIPYAGPGNPEPPGDFAIPRPAHWGGLRLYASAVELWVEGEYRIHDRARWERDLTVDGERVEAGPWRATRLHP